MMKSRERWVVRCLKGTIFIVVVVGLYIAFEHAVQQWRNETTKLTNEIAELNRQLETTLAADRRRELEQSKHRLEQSVPTFDHLRWEFVAAAALLYGFGIVCPAMLLRQAVVVLGQPCRSSVAIAAQLLGHLGKYVPGKAMVVVLRAGGLARDGVRPVVATVGVFMETLLMMAVGAATGGLITCWLPVPTWMIVAAAVMAVCAGLPTLPFVIERIARRMSDSGNAASTAPLRGRWTLFFSGWAWSLLSWLLIGGCFMLLILAIPTPQDLPPSGLLYAIALASITLAMVAGFASLLPGGAGVRELVLATVLAPSIGIAHALLAAIAARLVFIVVESLLGLLAWTWLRRQPNS